MSGQMMPRYQPSKQTGEHWSHLVSYGSPRTVVRGSLIYTPNEPAHTLYLLHGGQVSLSVISSGGRVLTLQVVEPGHLFGHSVLEGNQTYDTFAEALTPANMTAIADQRVQQALVEYPALGLELVKELGAYLMVVSRRLDEVAFKSVSARLASVLLDMAEDGASEQQLRLPRRTHQQLAEMTNSYRETVTKVINQFRADNLLAMDRSGITILNTTRLRELAQGKERIISPCK